MSDWRSALHVDMVVWLGCYLGALAEVGWVPDEVRTSHDGQFLDIFWRYSHEPPQAVKAKAMSLAGPLPDMMQFDGTHDEDFSVDSASGAGA